MPIDHSCLSVHIHRWGLLYDYGFPHAEWRRNRQAPGTKSKIDNTEAADSKKKISRKVDEPFITVTRKKKLETLFKQS